MKNPKIFIICGKARHGKDTVANMIKSYFKNQKTINLQYSSYIKDYAKKITNWDGSEATKPREFLQMLGTDIIRKQIDYNFFVNRIIDDIKIYSFFYDIITISDARTKVEIERVKESFDNVYAIKVDRPDFDNGLTLKQKDHLTETDLDDYDKYDYYLNNDGSLEELQSKVIDLMKVI